MKPAAVVFDIGNVLIEWQPERFYDSVIGEDRRRAMFAEVDLHGMNDRVDSGQHFTDTIYAAAEANPAWRAEIRMWHGIQSYDLAAQHYPFLRAFDRDFISGHMGMIKPDPAIYAALEDTSGLSGDALLFTDDRIDNINAANARGWQTHHFTGPDGWADRLVTAGLLTEEEAA